MPDYVSPYVERALARAKAMVVPTAPKPSTLKGSGEPAAENSSATDDD